MAYIVEGQPTSRRKGLFGLLAGVGCVWIALSIILPVILCGAFVAGLLTFVKSSDVYQIALERVQSDPDIVEALGEPIEPGWWVMGTIEIQGASGEAQLQFPVSGPRGDGVVHAGARKENAVWNFYTLGVNVEDEFIPID